MGYYTDPIDHNCGESQNTTQNIYFFDCCERYGIIVRKRYYEKRICYV